MLPAPESTVGKISTDDDTELYVYIGEVTKEQYDAYVLKCQEKGFNRDHDSGTESYDNSLYYYADNKDGYHLHIEYHEKDDLENAFWLYEKTMIIELYPPETEDIKESETTTEKPTVKPTQKPTQKPTEKAESKPESKNDSNAVSPSFKETMDSYEKFFDDYIAFMKKYKENPNDMELLTDYLDWMQKYSDYMEKLDSIDQDSLSDADLAYYIEVNTRISKKLLEANI